MSHLPKPYLIFFLCILFSNLILPQSVRKAVPEPVISSTNLSAQQTPSPFVIPKETNGTFSTTVYTFSNITIFSYFNDTQISVYNSSNTLIGSKTLNVDTYNNFTGLSSGVYRIDGNKTYTVLVGDAITSYVNGYFAVDEAGRALSTKLNTWMMQAYGAGSDFIVFAYNDNTGFTVKDLSNGSVLAAGTLNSGQHYSFAQSGTIPEKKALQVTGTQPISALSYSDQDYYIPSANGSFVGTLFYGYSAYIGSWTNSIVVTSYADNNSITVKNSNTGATISTFTLQRGQVHFDGIKAPTFWTITSSGPVSAANIPFAPEFTGSYNYMTRAIDETGKGFGKLFYVPTIGSQIHIFSFENGNSIKVTQLGEYTTFPYTGTTIKYQGTLDEGKYYNFSSLSGHYVYLIETTKYSSVLQSNGGAGADFMPLAYSLDYPDLAVSTADIVYSKDDKQIVAGDQITVTVTVHNYGSVAATNVGVIAYDGDPDLGGTAPPIGSGTIGSIPVNSSGTFSFSYKVPTSPEYHSIVVKVDPSNSIVESNESNNKAQRSIKPNNELLPPLAINVTAPSSLALQGGVLTPNPFKVHFDIFNTGTVDATNVVVTLELFNGLTLNTGTLVRNVGSIQGQKTAVVEYELKANASVSGFNFYKATITSSNADTKIITRAVNVPDATPPAAPANFKGQTAGPKGAILTWNSNSEVDLAGYFLYYSTDGINWNATGAKEGNSPIMIINQASFTLSQLPVNNPNGQNYWFMLKAFDSSNNLSSASTVVQLVILYQQSTTQVIFYGDSAFTWTIPAPQTGYVCGTNSYKDQGKYQRFDFTGSGSLTDARIYFSRAKVNGTSDQFNLVVKSVGTDGAPNTTLYTKSYATSVIDISQPGVKYNTFSISPALNVTVPFFIGIEWDPNIDDEFNIIADDDKQGNLKKRAWEKDVNGKYFDMYTNWTNWDTDLWIAAVVTGTNDIEEERNLIPNDYVLYQNYPNPFNPTTIIKYAVPKNSFVQLKVYDALGKEIAVLVNGDKAPGTYQVQLDSGNLTSGVYFYTLQSGNNIQTKKFVLMK